MAKIREKVKSIKQTSAQIEREIREKTVGYIVAGFSVVAGFAWNDAIKSFIEEYFPLARDTMKAKFIYAILITMLIVVISVYLMKLFRIEKKEKAKDKKDEEKEKNKEKVVENEAIKG